MSLEVRPDHLQMVTAILQAHIPGRKVLAFGSRVTGGARKTSDLDLCVLGEEALPLSVLAQLRDAFSLSSLPYKVDVVEWSQLSSVFQTIIAKQSMVIA